MGYVATYTYSATGKLTALVPKHQQGRNVQTAGYAYNADDESDSMTTGWATHTTYTL